MNAIENQITRTENKQNSLQKRSYLKLNFHKIFCFMLQVLLFALFTTVAMGTDINGGFEKPNPKLESSALKARLDKSNWSYYTPLVLPKFWRPNPYQKNGFFRYPSKDIAPHSGSNCVSFKGNLMCESALKLDPNPSCFQVDFYSKATAPGKVVFYLYGSKYVFLGSVSKSFAASKEWTQHSVSINIPKEIKGKKIMNLRLAFQSAPASGCAIDDVTISQKKAEVLKKKRKPQKAASIAAVKNGTDDGIEFKDFKMAAGTTKSFIFKQRDADARQIRFSFEAHLDWKSLGGWAPGLTVAVNGQAVSGARLLNKPLTFKTRNGAQSKWAAADRNSFLLMYSNDFSDAIKTNKKYAYGLYEKEQEPYRFVFDLTGLTQHVGENKITLKATVMPIVFRNIKITFNTKFMPRINDPKSMVKPAPTGTLNDFRLKPTKIPTISVNVNQTGGIAVKSEKCIFPLASRFSMPDGKWLEVDSSQTLAKAELPYEKSWTTPEYTIKRRVELIEGHLKVSDTFTNLRDKITGVMLKNTLKLPQKPQKIFMGGVEVMLKELKNTFNPSIGAQLGNSFIALILEDDIFRTQGYFSREAQSISIGDRNLGLPPKGSHTLVWSVYCIPNGGYYDFINAVRRDWKSNFTIDGPFSFPYGSGSDNTPLNIWTQNPIPKKTVDNFIAKRPVKCIITHLCAEYTTPLKIGHGTAIPQMKWWCDMTRNMTKALKKYAPQVKVYSYIHKNLCSEPGCEEKYKDSLALDATSRKLSQLSKNGSKRFVPTLNNSYGKKLIEICHYLVENLNTHIYMDEIALGVRAWYKYPEWDNCTVAINRSSHRVLGKLSIPNLLVKPWLEKMIAYLKSKKRLLIANGAPATRTLHNHHIRHFVEQGMGSKGMLNAHMSSPLGFCYHSGLKGFLHFRDALDCGFICFLHSGDWSNHVFPLTPLELANGYIISKERIVTKKSGRFGWNDLCKADIFVYDGMGKATNGQEVKTVTENGKTVFEVRMPSDYVAIIVKK